MMETEEIRKRSLQIAKELLILDSRDAGAILAAAAGTFLINAPDQKNFNDYKNAIIDSISAIEWKI